MVATPGAGAAAGQNAAFWNQVAGLARAATRAPDAGRYWQQFLQLAQQYGMSGPQLASHLSAFVGSNVAARTALTGLRNVLAAGLLGGSQAAAVGSAVTAAEGAAVGGAAVVGVGAGSAAAAPAAGVTIGTIAAGVGAVILAGVLVGGILWATGVIGGDDDRTEVTEADVELHEFEEPLYAIHVIRRHTTSGPVDDDQWLLHTAPADGDSFSLADDSGGTFLYDVDASLGPVTNNIDACNLVGTGENLYIPVYQDFAICN